MKSSVEAVGARGYFQRAGLSEEVMFESTNEKEPDLEGEYSSCGQGLWGLWAVTASQWKPALVDDD